jgi:hypothetical protein
VILTLKGAFERGHVNPTGRHDKNLPLIVVQLPAEERLTFADQGFRLLGPPGEVIMQPLFVERLDLRLAVLAARPSA